VNPLTFWYDKFMLSGHLRPFFWEIDTDHFDPMLYPQYTIARLLEFGDPDAISWLREQFPEETIKNVIRADRTLSPDQPISGLWFTAFLRRMSPH